MQGNRDRGKKTASTDLPAVYCGGKACPYISLPQTPLEWEPLALGLPYRLKSQATTEPNTPIQSSTADSKHLSGHNSISQHNSVLGRGTYIHMDGERSPFFAGWWCGRCLTAIPPSAGAPPPVATRRCPSASILVGDIAPSSAAISLCPSSSSSRPAPRTKTRANPAGIKSPPNRAESNPRERHEPGRSGRSRPRAHLWRSEAAGRRRGRRRPARISPRAWRFRRAAGSRAASERASQGGGGECEGGGGRGGVSPFIYDG